MGGLDRCARAPGIRRERFHDQSVRRTRLLYRIALAQPLYSSRVRSLHELCASSPAVMAGPGAVHPMGTGNSLATDGGILHLVEQRWSHLDRQKRLILQKLANFFRNTSTPPYPNVPH